MSVKLPRVPEELEGRIEDRISSFEENHEENVFQGKDGEIPHIRWKDYLISAVIGIVLTLYLLIEFFII